MFSLALEYNYWVLNYTSKSLGQGMLLKTFVFSLFWPSSDVVSIWKKQTYTRYKFSKIKQSSAVGLWINFLYIFSEWKRVKHLKGLNNSY